MPTKRRKNPGGYPCRHVVRCTHQEEKALQDKAEALGITVSRFLMEAALGKNLHMQKRLQTTELIGIRRTLDGIGTNLNQVARYVNSGGDPSTSSTELAELHTRVSGAVAAINAWISEAE